MHVVSNPIISFVFYTNFILAYQGISLPIRSLHVLCTHDLFMPAERLLNLDSACLFALCANL